MSEGAPNFSEKAPTLHAAVERNPDVNKKKIEDLGRRLDEMGREDLREELEKVMVIMNKPRDVIISEEERNQVRKMISIAGQIQTAMAGEKAA